MTSFKISDKSPNKQFQVSSVVKENLKKYSEMKSLLGNSLCEHNFNLRNIYLCHYINIALFQNLSINNF